MIVNPSQFLSIPIKKSPSRRPIANLMFQRENGLQMRSLILPTQHIRTEDERGWTVSHGR